MPEKPNFLSPAFIKLEEETLRRKKSSLPPMDEKEVIEFLKQEITRLEDYDFFQAIKLYLIISEAIGDRTLRNEDFYTPTQRILHSLVAAQKLVIGIPAADLDAPSLL